ncbi:14027_t:CDS:2 [Cetraspora pellucida]|uniref:14027_t:CDS:1 n=1 Tax=Cetraspora pellucida TaxID=1433469 RepID=A0A9N9KBM2_9GLOM|nr:14027_t:CDS:2 [Cetraspora pellucida]
MSNLILLLEELKNINIKKNIKEKKIYTKKKNEFHFNIEYINEKKPNDNILIIKFKSKINNNDENLIKNPKYLPIFSKEISNPLVYGQGVSEFLTEKLINFFSDNLSNNNDIAQKFLNSKHINFIISHKEDIKIKDFIKLEKIITLDIENDVKHNSIKERKNDKNIKPKTEEEKSVNTIIEEMSKLNLSEQKEKYINLSIILKIERILENLKDVELNKKKIII